MNFSSLKQAFQKNSNKNTISPEKIKEILDEFCYEYQNLPLKSLSFEEYIEFVSKLRYDGLFSIFDPQGTGKITAESLKKLCKEIDWEINEDEIEEMIEIGDINKDGALDKKEFFNLLKQNKL